VRAGALTLDGTVWNLSHNSPGPVASARASHATGPPSRRRRFGASTEALAQVEASRRSGERGRV
jgi:hypothetical protein